MQCRHSRYFELLGSLDWLIETYCGQLGNPVEFYSCFISYATGNLDFAERLHADLQNKGVRCWFAPQDMKTADRIGHGVRQPQSPTPAPPQALSAARFSASQLCRPETAVTPGSA